jgi:RND family efflux transporter MFP subunit
VLCIIGCNKKENENKEAHSGERPKLKITAYNTDYELFAEADPLVVGDNCNVLSHFSLLPAFRALDSGSITIRLITGDQEVAETLEKPTRKGIFSFNLKPQIAGSGRIVFDINNGQAVSQLIVPDIMVFSDKVKADEHAGKLLPSMTNTIVFTKEQSWKINFATSMPDYGPFGQVIKTTAQVGNFKNEETVISAKTNGILVYPDAECLEGSSVNAGKTIFFIRGSDLSDNNLKVKYEEARNNFNLAKAEYERKKLLASEKIVSGKELMQAMTVFENSSAVYNNLSRNFTSDGQNVTSPVFGYIKQFYVSNGQYVEAGQKLATVIKNENLLLQADVQQKYAPLLNTVQSAVIRSVNNNRSYTLEELKGKIISYGKCTNSDNYLIPVNLQVENNGAFIPGSILDLFLHAGTGNDELTVPNTALLEEQGNYSILVQINPELFERREVFVGATDGLNTVITKGLSRTERIVTKGAVLVKLAQATNALDPHSGHNH